jgi:hypothetical protein
MEQSEEYYYNTLKDDSFERKGYFRCPFCWNIYYENLRDVSKHAERVGNVPNRYSQRQRNKHTAAVKYINSLESKPGHVKPSTSKTGLEKLFIWPWTVILANNARIKDSKTKKNVRKNEQEIGDKLRSKGYEFSDILLFSNNREHTEFGIVICGKESADFTNAMSLADAFKSGNHGKEKYFERKKDRNLGEQLYGWMAGYEEFENDDEVGRYLRDHMELTVSRHSFFKRAYKQYCQNKLRFAFL